mmetsp:Transcript_10282/g.18761  ORF Transcript_10282/g.18761 Transcript_10282/m.18761 type:complete len:354 (+) Transcript_10282:766-1827(+)
MMMRRNTRLSRYFESSSEIDDLRPPPHTRADSRSTRAEYAPPRVMRFASSPMLPASTSVLLSFAACFGLQSKARRRASSSPPWTDGLDSSSMQDESRRPVTCCSLPLAFLSLSLALFGLICTAGSASPASLGLSVGVVSFLFSPAAAAIVRSETTRSAASTWRLTCTSPSPESLRLWLAEMFAKSPRLLTPTALYLLVVFSPMPLRHEIGLAMLTPPMRSIAARVRSPTYGSVSPVPPPRVESRSTFSSLLLNNAISGMSIARQIACLRRAWQRSRTSATGHSTNRRWRLVYAVCECVCVCLFPVLPGLESSSQLKRMCEPRSESPHKDWSISKHLATLKLNLLLLLLLLSRI